MEEIHRASHEERARGFHALSERAALPTLPPVHQLGSSQNTVLLGFMEALLRKHNGLNHWPLATNSTSSPSALLGGQGMGFI